MTTFLIPSIKAYIAGDSIIQGLMPGGVKDSEDFPRGISYEEAPKLPNGVQINPFINITYDTSGPDSTQPVLLPFERQFMSFWFYDNSSYTSIKAAILRVKTLMHYHYFQVDDFSSVKALWAGDVSEFDAEELNKASAGKSRYSLELMRRINTI